MSDTLRPIEVQIALQDVEIHRLKSDVDRIIQDIKFLKESLTEYQKTVAQAKGGYKMLTILGSIGATAGAVIGWFVENFIVK